MEKMMLAIGRLKEGEGKFEKFMAFFQLVDSSKLENANKKTSNSDLRYNDFEGNGKDAPQKTSPAIWGKVGRNSQCPCGSGKKYKNCHGKN